MRLLDRLGHWLRRHPQVATEVSDVPPGPVRGPMDLVVVLDGTMGHLRDLTGQTNAGRAFLLMREAVTGRRRALYYEPGLQWEGWRNTLDVLQGRGINRQIRRAYGWLASHYRPGDRIYLLGYSRGAFAVRSLAGVIDRVGLLRADAATERHVQLAYRHYERAPDSPAARAFARRHCHADTSIQMVGVWDTVKALGLRLPLLWLLTERRHAFHNHHLGRHIRHGFHALALDETRSVFEPVLWACSPAQEGCQSGTVQQVWFRGSHGDVGGQLGGFEAARPLANIPLIWMLECAEAAGLTLPPGWRTRFPVDPEAPAVGNWRGWGALFLLRRRRLVGRDRSESLHPSALCKNSAGRWSPWPLRRTPRTDRLPHPSADRHPENPPAAPEAPPPRVSP